MKHSGNLHDAVGGGPAVSKTLCKRRRVVADVHSLLGGESMKRAREMAEIARSSRPDPVQSDALRARMRRYALPVLYR
ncbi:hypothetical protein [Pectobacterium parvum]|uniref:Uncharacterized protein n=1 Tax=Pectobacterium parvum TaxID=2778550 RepID=A0AAP9IBJ4_9GAMM|nr:hypothetical protein [Pectobacterium parvum]QHQ22667.1 hypothetical protein GMX10_00005 [Pectobacterium parvum]